MVQKVDRRMKYFLASFLLIILVNTCFGQSVFKKMYGQLSPDNFELKEICFSNKFVLSNHNSFNGRHTFFKINETGEPYNQNYIYQPIGGSTTGSHKYYFRNDTVYDLIGLHATPGTYPAVAFISRRDSSLLNVILSRFYEYRPSAPGIISCMNLDFSYSIGGGYAVAPGQYYPMIFKLDTGLHLSWSQSYRDRVGYVQDMVQAHDGGYYLLMHLVNEGMTLTKTDSIGTIQWSKQYSMPYRKAQRMLLSRDSSLLLLGYKDEHLLFNNYTGIYPVITKVDFSGNVIWSISYGNQSNEFISWAGNPKLTLDTAANGRYVLCGSLVTQWHSYADILLLTINNYGLPIWARRYGNDFFDELGSVCHQTSDDGFIVGGFNNYQVNNFPPVFNQANITVIKTDSLGFSDGCMEYPVTIYSEPDTPLVSNLTWVIYVDSIVTEIPSDMVDTTGTPTRNEDMCTFVSLLELSDKQPDFEIFPNPNSGEFQIKFNKNTNSKIVKVDILDLMGRIFFTYIENSENQISLSIPNIVPGMYVINVTVDETVFTKKMVIE